MDQLNLAFAFTAGLFSTINPCGWAMLPSFVSFYLGSPEDEDPRRLRRRLFHGLTLGLLLTAGFLSVFLGAGLAITAGLRALVRYMPFAAMAVGLSLVALGLWLLSGRIIPFSLPQPRLGLQPRDRKSGVLFGAAYGLASLSCTLPIFLAVVGAGTAADSFGVAGAMFLAYGAGMATVLMSVALSAVWLKDSLLRWFQGWLPYVHRLGAALLILAGLYLIWFQARYLPEILSAL